MVVVHLFICNCVFALLLQELMPPPCDMCLVPLRCFYAGIAEQSEPIGRFMV